MYSKTKTVYYCGFCKKKGFQKNSMEKHESYCTMNPDRICRWTYIDARDYRETHQIDLRSLAQKYGNIADSYIDEKYVDELREDVEHCPGCMLAVIRLSGRSPADFPFSFQKEVERYNDERRDEDESREIAALTSGWL